MQGTGKGCKSIAECNLEQTSDVSGQTTNKEAVRFKRRRGPQKQVAFSPNKHSRRGRRCRHISTCPHLVDLGVFFDIGTEANEYVRRGDSSRRQTKDGITRPRCQGEGRMSKTPCTLLFTRQTKSRHQRAVKENNPLALFSSFPPFCCRSFFAARIVRNSAYV